MISTASRALRPRHGAPAECAASPENVYSTETSPFPPACPQLTPNWLETWVNTQASTSSKCPSRTNQALVPTTSSATPGHITMVPGMFSRSMTSLAARAPAMMTAWPELCPSPWPGAPDTSGSRYATPGFWDDLGIPSMSLPSAITGPPEPHRANHAVGMPETPSSTSKPFSRSTPTR